MIGNINKMLLIWIFIRNSLLQKGMDAGVQIDEEIVESLQNKYVRFLAKIKYEEQLLKMLGRTLEEEKKEIKEIEEINGRLEAICLKMRENKDKRIEDRRQEYEIRDGCRQKRDGNEERVRVSVEVGYEYLCRIQKYLREEGSRQPLEQHLRLIRREQENERKHKEMLQKLEIKLNSIQDQSQQLILKNKQKN